MAEDDYWQHDADRGVDGQVHNLQGRDTEGYNTEGYNTEGYNTDGHDEPPPAFWPAPTGNPTSPRSTPQSPDLQPLEPPVQPPVGYGLPPMAPPPGQPPVGYGLPPMAPPPAGPGSPGFAPAPGGSSSGGRWVGVAVAAIVGVVVLAGLGFAIVAMVGRVEDVREAQPDLNEATLEQLEEVTSDVEVERSEAECIEDRMEGDSTTLNDVFTDVTGDAREAMVQAMLDCFPDPANSDALVGSFSANLELGMGGNIDVDNEEGSCMVQYVLDNSPNPARTLSEADGVQDAQLLLESFELCLDPEDLALVMGEAGTGPQAYGDDERLDSLYDDCGAGDGRACDVLYLRSSVDSEYELFALDCGGLPVQDSGWCTPGVVFDANLEVREDDPGLLEQAAECELGDMTACDFVFMVSPFGSEIARVGFTCGGEIPVGALPDCRTRLGN